MTDFSYKPPPTEEELTFEKVWTMFLESDRKFQESRTETDRQMKELAINII
ncbi:MAG: hypothetical protein FWH41_05325 [Treponema sp.]|nr:hypothetical protein [Treponema sp.]